MIVMLVPNIARVQAGQIIISISFINTLVFNFIFKSSHIVQNLKIIF